MKTYLAVIIFLCCAIISDFSQAQSSNKPAPPLVDGDCSEYASLNSEKIPLSKEVTLNVYQDDHYVWLCYGYPDGSFGTMDLSLKTKSLPETLNLHVSAQLGEWPVDKPDLAPKTPESELWWNTKGWIANPVWIKWNG